MKIATLLICAVALAAVMAKPALRRADASAQSPVLVELFTSEGCSSCPPADKLLTNFVATQPADGAQIIALEEHVDYWNNGSWSDPFSSKTFSSRQNGYSNAFRDDSVYTPEMVVDGRKGFVGSDRGQALAAIADASEAQKAMVRLAVTKGAVPSQLALNIQIDHFPGGRSGHPCNVVLAVTEDGLRSHITGGENEGRSLIHTSVVRRMQVVDRKTFTAGNPYANHAAIALDPSWNRAHLHLVVFLQDVSTLQVLGAAIVPA